MRNWGLLIFLTYSRAFTPISAWKQPPQKVVPTLPSFLFYPPFLLLTPFTAPPQNPARGLGERSKLPERGPQMHFYAFWALKKCISWQHLSSFMCNANDCFCCGRRCIYSFTYSPDIPPDEANQ